MPFGRRETLRRVTWALLLAGLLLAIVPCIQQLTGTFEEDYGGFGQRSERGFRTGEGDARQLRLAGAIGEQNRFAQVLLMLIPLGLAIGLHGARRGLRWAALATTGVITVGMALTFSRGAFLGLAIVTVVALGLRLVRGRHVAVLALAGCLALAALPQVWSRVSTLSSIPALFADEQDAQAAADGSLRRRAAEMIGAALVFADHPLFGVGPGGFKSVSQRYCDQLGFRELGEGRRAHSLLLEIAAELGIVGLVAFLAVFFVVLRDLLHVRRRWESERPLLSHLASGYALALVAYLATGLFLHLAYARYLWVMLAIAATIPRIAAALERTPSTDPA